METKSEEQRFLTNVESLGSFLVEEVDKLHSGGDTTLKPTYVSFVFRFLTSKGGGIISHFIDETSDKWDMVKNRDTAFVVNFIIDTLNKYRENSSIPISEITEEKREEAEKLFEPENPKGISEESLALVWDYLDALIIIAVKYVHKCREPAIVITDEEKKKVYRKNLFPNVKVMRFAAMWGFKKDLEWHE